MFNNITKYSSQNMQASAMFDIIQSRVRLPINTKRDKLRERIRLIIILTLHRFFKGFLSNTLYEMK